MSNELQNAIDAGSHGADSVPERIAVDVDEVFERLYDKIRCLASRVRWSGTNPTLNPTALAHEAYLKLRREPPDLASKSYEEVIGIFANAMHQVLLDAARRKSARKRVPVNLPDSIELPVEDALTIAEALEKLQSENPRQVQIVRCRFLLGMTTAETAAALRIGTRTVEREWQEARASLSRRLEPAKE